MKKLLLLLPLCSLLLFAFIPTEKSIVGHWTMFYGNGIKGTSVFRSNGTYEGTFDGHQWKIGGQYKVDGDVSSITDSVCGFGYWGKYKSTWYTDDSLRMTAVEDSCTGRKANADGLVMVRVKM